MGLHNLGDENMSENEVVKKDNALEKFFNKKLSGKKKCLSWREPILTIKNSSRFVWKIDRKVSLSHNGFSLSSASSKTLFTI